MIEFVYLISFFIFLFLTVLVFGSWRPHHMSSMRLAPVEDRDLLDGGISETRRPGE